MGLFTNKKAGAPAADEVVSTEILDDPKYREELREIGREQFKKRIDAQSTHLDHEINIILESVAAEIKIHASRKVDALISRLNTDITNQLNEQMREHNRVAGEAQELVAQSVSRNAQMVHEKFQQLSLNLQRVVADQEVSMATVFQDSKTQVAAIQSEQAKVLEQLRLSEDTTRREAEELTKELRATVKGQAAKLDEIYKDNMAGVEKTKDKQAAMLDTLAKTTAALEGQHAELSQLLDKTIADQKAMVTEIINDNMSRIVEHYLVGALGEQSNIREQMPSILERLEENKQAMMDDMKL